MINVKTLWMATTSQESLPTRRIIRDLIADRLSADGCRISTVGSAYTITICPQYKSQKESLAVSFNIPTFLIICDKDYIVVKTVRPTSTRTIAHLEYADPLLMENLAEALQPLGICLVV